MDTPQILPHTARSERRVLPYLALVFGALALGFSAIFVTWANAPGAVSGFYRMAISAAVFALPAALDARRRRPLAAPAGAPGRSLTVPLLLAALGGLFFALDLVLWNTAVLITSAASATLLGNTSPLWVGLGALLVFKEKLRPAFWAGLLVAMLGAVVVLSGDYLAHPQLGVGDLLSLAAGCFYGLFFLAAERARTRLSSLSAWWVSAAASTVVLLVLSLALRQPLWGYSVDTYLNLVALALVTQVGGYLAINYALGHLPASLVAPTLLMQPVITALLAVPLLRQPIGLLQVLGGVLVLAGIAAVHRTRSA